MHGLFPKHTPLALFVKKKQKKTNKPGSAHRHSGPNPTARVFSGVPLSLLQTSFTVQKRNETKRNVAHLRCRRCALFLPRLDLPPVFRSLRRVPPTPTSRSRSIEPLLPTGRGRARLCAVGRWFFPSEFRMGMVPKGKRKSKRRGSSGLIAAVVRDM